ncbi:MAG: hypothetical protein R3254_07635 [Thiomicrorhabdus sp.]|nr:hypothetical protein [Thiomicrorhabdus sp.]
MLKIKPLLLIVFLLLTGCSSQEQSSIKLLTNAWIGYSPLFYAKEKGWLKEANIEISPLVSLGESMMTFRSGGFAGLTGTQYEYHKLNSANFDLVPIIMFDRSRGGDMVMGNRSIEALHQTTERIDVYLEMNSINSVVFNDFIKAHQLTHKTFHFINLDQLKIVTTLSHKKPTKPTLIVTYVPYNFDLNQSGFETLDSTANAMNIIVLDALYVKSSQLKQHHENFIKLKNIVDKAIHNLKQDPQEFYEVVKPYIENPTYEEFLQSLNDIEWLNKPLPSNLLEKMNDINFQTRNLL